MKILFYDWIVSIGSKKLIQTMEQHGWDVKVFQFYRDLNKNQFEDEEFERELNIQMEEADAVFSFNFLPLIARNCYFKHKKYISWCFDCPLFQLFSKETQYDTNYIFVFDLDQLKECEEAGIKNIYYLPLAANMICDEIEEPIKYQCEVSFVGRLYDDNLYREIKHMPEYVKGYLEGIMTAQKLIYGADVLSDLISSSHMKEIEKLVKFGLDKERYVFLDDKKMFLSVILEKEISCQERVDIVKRMAGNFDFHLYTNSDTSDWTNVKNFGIADYDTQLGKIYQTSKINLNITAKNIHHGVPMRIFDILSVGGFCISNYQRGLEELFELGTDLVVYDDYNDLMYKTAYYLEHEEERLQIAENGRKKVREYHLYEHRLKEIEKVVMGEKSGQSHANQEMSKEWH